MPNAAQRDEASSWGEFSALVLGSFLLFLPGVMVFAPLIGRIVGRGPRGGTVIQLERRASTAARVARRAPAAAIRKRAA